MVQIGRKSKKILLVTPAYHCGVVESAGTWLPLGLAYLAGALEKAGYEVEIYDAMAKFTGLSEIAAKIEEARPDVIATGAYTAPISDAVKILRLTKKLDPSILTILGGVHPTFCWRELLHEDDAAIDFIIRGEGEETIVELLEALNVGRDVAHIAGLVFVRDGRIVRTPDRPFIRNLDALTAAWGLLDWRDYTYRPKPGSTLAVASSSRGCNQRCTFCSQQVFWKRSWRARRPERFVSEIEQLNTAYGVDVVMITDETPTIDRRRWEAILDLLIKKELGVELLMETRVDDVLRDEDILEKYWGAGIRHVYVGVESGSQETLNRFHKNLKVEESRRAIELINQAGMISETSFVLGMPEETPESIEQTVKLAQHYNPDLAFFLAIAPWPYSEIYEELKPHVEVFDYSKYNLVEPVVKPVKMTRRELNRALVNAFRTFYMGKLSQLDTMSSFKRDYMVAVTKLLATHSYLAKYMKGMGTMPDQVKKLLA